MLVTIYVPLILACHLGMLLDVEFVLELLFVDAGLQGLDPGLQAGNDNLMHSG